MEWEAQTHVSLMVGRRRLTPEDLGRVKTLSFLEYAKAYFRVCVDPRVIIMFFQYGACFGTELTMYNQLPRPATLMLCQLWQSQSVSCS